MAHRTTPYSPEERAKILRYWQESGSLSKTAAKFRVARQSIRNWKRNGRNGSVVNEMIGERDGRLESEIDRLRSENALLLNENQLLTRRISGLTQVVSTYLE